MCLLLTCPFEEGKGKGKCKGKGKGKDKAIPVQVWTDPEGCRKLRLLDFETIGI
jgi:hypothetical protein